jgi:hypothetical protein
MLIGLPLIKVATQITAGLGVSKIVADIVQNNVTMVTPVQAVTVRVGSFVLGSMLWEASTKHIDSQLDHLTTMLKKNQAETPVAE